MHVFVFVTESDSQEGDEGNRKFIVTTAEQMNRKLVSGKCNDGLESGMLALNNMFVVEFGGRLEGRCGRRTQGSSQ